MINQDVLTYIKNELARGSSLDTIKKNLIAGGGWTSADIDFHFGFLNTIPPERVAPVPVAPKVETPIQEVKQEIINLQNMTSLMTHSPVAPSLSETMKNVAAPEPITRSNLVSPVSIINLEPQKISILKPLLALIVVLLLGGGGAYGYYYYTNSTDDQPEKNFAKMVANLPSIKSFEYTGEFSLGVDKFSQDITSSIKPPMTGTLLSVKQTGTFDASDSENTVAKQNTIIAVDMASFPTGLNSSTLKGSVTIDTLLVNHFLYIKVIDLPTALSSYVDVSMVNNHWFTLGTSTLQSAEELQPEIADKLGSIDQQKLDKVEEQYGLHPIFKIKTNLGSEKINNMDTYHYGVTLDKTNAKLLAPILLKLDQESTPAMTPADEIKLEQITIEAIEAMDEATAEIWIGKKDYMPYKVMGIITMDAAKMKSTAVNGSGKISVRISITASEFNKKFNLTAPSDSRPIEELISEIFSASMQSPETISIEPKLK